MAPTASTSVRTPSSRSWIIFYLPTKAHSRPAALQTSAAPGPPESPSPYGEPIQSLAERQGLLRGPYICSQPGTSSARAPGRRDESGTVPKEQTLSLTVWLACCLPSQAGVSTEPSPIPLPEMSRAGLHFAHWHSLQPGPLDCGRGECHLLCCD